MPRPARSGKQTGDPIPREFADPGKFQEFEKILDFLIEQKARFLTPMELAAELRERD